MCVTDALRFRFYLRPGIWLAASMSAEAHDGVLSSLGTCVCSRSFVRRVVRSFEFVLLLRERALLCALPNLISTTQAALWCAVGCFTLRAVVP